jgi:hypothetical protein
MPSRHSTGHRLLAAAILVVYVAPVLVLGLSRLTHEAFHAVGEPMAVSPDESHSHHHPHSHDGGPAHTHTHLLDILLATSVADDVIDDAQVPAPQATGPGVHLSERGFDFETVPAHSSLPRPVVGPMPAGHGPLPPTPPPRA